MSASPIPSGSNVLIDSTIPSSSTLPPSKKFKGRPKGSKSKAKAPSTPPAEFQLPGLSSIHWDADGNEQVPSSLNLLIEWLGMGRNFEYFKFGKDGKNQVQMAKVCSEWMQARGCANIRSATSIQNKVSQQPWTCFLIAQVNALMGQWKKARDWKEGTGNGILDAAENAETRESAKDDVMGEHL